MKTAILATALAVSASMAIAQPQNCGPREAIISQLAEKYGEIRLFLGLATDRKTVIEVWGNSETGTWTVTVTHPNGMTCYPASGMEFETEGVALDPARFDPEA